MRTNFLKNLLSFIALSARITPSQNLIQQNLFKCKNYSATIGYNGFRGKKSNKQKHFNKKRHGMQLRKKHLKANR
jgi:hypothetical protein